MNRLLVNGEVPQRGDEKELQKFLNSLYKDDVIELALQFIFEKKEKDQQIAELKARVEELEESEKLGIEYEKNAKKCIDYWHMEFDMLNKKFIEKMDKTYNLQYQLQALQKKIVEEIDKLDHYCFNDEYFLLESSIYAILDNLLKKFGEKT